MAKVNKSKEIRNYVTKHPTAPAKEVMAALAKRGVKVTVALIGNVKSKAGLTKSRKKPGRKKKATSTAGNDLNFDALVDAKRLIVKAGSAQAAIAMVKAVEKLDSLS